MLRRLWSAVLPLVLAVLLATGCVSSDLAKQNLTNVRAQVGALRSHDVVAPARAEPAAEELLEATGTVEQILGLGVPTELAAENLQNVRTMSDAIRISGIEDPAPSAEPVAAELARQAGATQAAIDGIKPVAGPWWLPFAGIMGAAGAAFTTWKTISRTLKTKKAKKDEAAPAPPAPSSAAPPPA